MALVRANPGGQFRPVMVWACLLFSLATGCATQRVITSSPPLTESRLIVTRSADKATLSWESEPGMAYTVYYNHTRKAGSPWQILPGFDRIRGTGRMLTYTDRVPVNEARYYRLHTEPAISLGP